MKIEIVIASFVIVLVQMRMTLARHLYRPTRGRIIVIVALHVFCAMIAMSILTAGQFAMIVSRSRKSRSFLINLDCKCYVRRSFASHQLPHLRRVRPRRDKKWLAWLACIIKVQRRCRESPAEIDGDDALVF